MPLRILPSIEVLSNELAKSSSLPKALITSFVRQEVNHWRQTLLAAKASEKNVENQDKHSRETIEKDIRTKLNAFGASRLQHVINATGVVIHTNLGRSPLGDRVFEALRRVATGYSNLEFNLPGGDRGKRAGYLETALACLLEAPAATAVNNCAAALVLILRTLTTPEKNEVIVSRSELVEIGGGFRVPEILETSGAKLVEVGATNKTHLKDYAKAITPKTALILKVHRSNFYIEGFTDEPEVKDISELAKQHGIPLVEDIGSGAMMNTEDLAPLDHEPTPQEALRNGIDLVCFSGDKLLGGPQSGIIAGRADLVAEVKQEPFFRAVRCDKLILTLLQECIEEYLRTQANPASTDIPALQFLATSPDKLTERAQAIRAALPTELQEYIQVETSTARTGGGTMPKSAIPSAALSLTHPTLKVTRLAKSLRLGTPAIVGYTVENALKLDLRTVFEQQDKAITQRLTDILSENSAS